MIDVTLRFIGFILLTGIILVLVGWLWGIFKTQIFLPMGSYINSSQYYGTYQYLLYEADVALKYAGGILLFGGFIWFILNVLKTRYEQEPE